MARREDYEQEMSFAKRGGDDWSLKGRTAVVKIVPLGKQSIDESGFITTARFIAGMTPAQIEKNLGLKVNSLCFGARIYRFLRLPRPGEYTYELSARNPDGAPYDKNHSHPDWPQGSDKVLQWRINKGVQIPVDTATALELKPGQVVPHGWVNG